ncbi:WYL domain-containing protein [uncultured Campylobacter sp.]|uniref:helix-turn-helix transcriptional regulator n=1 Tax=uncultured Campylobacter sp. TaxID=218934 RepID=UPI002613D1C9|nr:WYL domain-containing protein [uncultured Campylobacter sp.]
MQKPQKIIPQSGSNKYERINEIATLISRKPHSISELAEKFGVCTKTIQRDLYEVLAKNGAVRNGRMWSIDKTKIKDGLDQEERTVINILDNISKTMGANFYSKAHVLLEQITNRLNHPILTNISSEKLSEDDFINFELLENAAKEKRLVECEYNNFKFKIKPLKLAMFDGFWYLLFLDIGKNDTFKKFHLKSIANIKVLEGKFEVEAKIEDRLKNINSAWATLDEPKTARLLLAPQIKKYFERKPYAKQNIMGQDPDGSVVIDIEYTNIMEIKPLIYYYIPFVKVLEPKELADVVKDETGEYFRGIK